MLKLRFKNNKHNSVWLVEPKVTIGRANSNDVVLEEPELAEQHAEILVKHEHLVLVNLSGQPLHVNNHLVEKTAELKVSDQINFGKTCLEVIDPKSENRPVVSETTGWALKANHTALANRVFAIKTETVIGRSRECDIPLAAAHLSRRHVKLFVQDGLLYLRDLGSANGTYLNGERVTEARVRRGDELRFDTLSFGVIGPPSEDLDKTTVRTMGAAAEANGASAVSDKVASKNPAVRRPRPAVRPVVAAANTESHAPVKQEPKAEEQLQAGARRGKLILGLLAVLLVGAGLTLVWQQGWLGI